MSMKCTTVAVTDDNSAPVEVLRAVSSSGRTANRQGVFLSLAKKKADGSDEHTVMLAFGNKVDFTADNGHPIYPGESRFITSEQAAWRGIVSGSIYALCAEGESATLRVQEF